MLDISSARFSRHFRGAEQAEFESPPEARSN